MARQEALAFAPTGDPLEAVVATHPESHRDLGPCSGTTPSASETRSKDGPAAREISDHGQCPLHGHLPEASEGDTNDAETSLVVPQSSSMGFLRSPRATPACPGNLLSLPGTG